MHQHQHQLMLLRACLRRVVWVASVVALVVAVVVIYSSRGDRHHQFTIHRNQKRKNNLRRWLSWSDPKTVVEKPPPTTTTTSHLTNEDNDNNDGLDVSKLRIVAFGTSKTWGAGLKHPDREVRLELLLCDKW